MKIKLLAMAFAASLLVAVSPAQARNYDCSKAGNANKAVCKGGVPSATAVTPGTNVAPMTPVKSSARHYDCTKAGNANKASCKGAMSTAASTPAVATKPHWWSKSSAAAPVSAPAPTVAMRPGSSASSVMSTGPQGATAKCKDGSFSHSAHHSGSCSHHGGVAQFF